ncbi:MAG: cysteine--tRNA ligase [Desulfovermiculus sp.]|nr:cysteine--tRNA ligase [Desulfovermiculus sp.]
MKIYNSISRRKEEFTPKQPGKVSLYVCGITAYDYCHIGHARAAVVFDVLVRYLRFRGYQVTFVRNFTDVDDKIINRSREEGIDSQAVAEKYIQAFYQDMDLLNILHPDYEPRATEHIQDMQEVIQTLINKGYAYATPGGDVYFRVRHFSEYGRLSGRNIEELQAGARIEPDQDKEDPLDFALWKQAKPDEPAWSSPWGQGRPGWHIECSAMSQRFVHLPLDIHGGGQDLIFPHHENERAQSMAASGRDFVRYWMHNGFVQVKDEKMSKSLGNFFTLRDIYEHFLPEVLRFFLLSQHYRSPLDFSFEGLQEAEKGLKRVYQAKMHLEAVLDSLPGSKGTELPAEIKEEMRAASSQWQSSLDDDLNTAAALGYAFSLVRVANRILEDKKLRKASDAGQICRDIMSTLQDIGAVLGLFDQDSGAFLHALRSIRAARAGVDSEKVEELIAERQQARKEKDFARADTLREQLTELGISVQDTPAGPVWDLD